MADPNPIMQMLFQQNSFVGPAERVEDEIEPLADQFNIAPGHKAIVAAANTMLESDFVVVEVLDPAEYEETFPDWVDRVTVKAHLLCRAWSRDDPEESIGWYSRLKLLPITDHEFEEVMTWVPDRWPAEMPEWAKKTYQWYTDELSKRAPHRVPTLVTCPSCQERRVELKVIHRHVLTGLAGQLTIEGRTIHVPVNNMQEDEITIGVLKCTSCGSYATLEPGEWETPPES